MSEVVSAPVLPEAAYPQAISLRAVWPWAVFAAALLMVVLYFVGSYQGSAWLHEFVHDGRHLLGFPCH